MSEEENKSVTSQALSPIELMAKDLGLDPSSVTDLNIKDVIKQGPESALFIARVSQVYLQSNHLNKEVEQLKAENTDLKKSLKESDSRCAALEKTKSSLEKENDYLSNRAQNSILSTVFFSLGSIAIGIAGSYFSQNNIESASLSGVIGVTLSVFAASLLLKKGGSKK